MDVFEKLVKDGGPIGQHMDRAHGYFTFPKLEGELGPRMQFRGKDMIVWSLNNYLGWLTIPMLEKWMQKQLQNMAWVIQWEQG